MTGTVFVSTDVAGRPIEISALVENEEGISVTEIFHTLRWADNGELLSDQFFDFQRTDYFYATCR